MVHLRPAPICHGSARRLGGLLVTTQHTSVADTRLAAHRIKHLQEDGLSRARELDICYTTVSSELYAVCLLKESNLHPSESRYVNPNFDCIYCLNKLIYSLTH